MTNNQELPTKNPFAPEAPKLAPLPAGLQGGVLTPEVVTQIQQAQASAALATPDAAATPATATAVPAPSTQSPAPESEDPRRKAVLKELRKVIREDLQKFMRPEMVNRFDEICIFEPLTLQQITAIVSLILAGTQERLAEQEYYLEVGPAVKELLAQRGYDPAFGARPLKRVIQREVDNVLSSKLISGAFAPKDVILATVEGKEIVFNKKEPVASGQSAVAAAQTPNTQDPTPGPVAVPGLQAGQNPVFATELPPVAGQAAPLEMDPPAFPSENPPRVNQDWQ